MLNTPEHQILIKFFKAGTRMSATREEIVHTSDEHKKQAYLIDRGYIKSYTITGEGGLNVLNIYGPGTVFPLGPLLRNASDSSTFHMREPVYFEAMTAVDIYWRLKSEMLELADRQLLLYRELTARLISNYDIYLNRVEGSQFKQAHQRLAYQLLVLGSHFGKTIRGKCIIGVQLTHQDLADSLGMARETVSRSFDTLRSKDLVETKDGHLIIDTEGLEAELS